MKYLLWVVPLALPAYVIHFFIATLPCLIIRPFNRSAADRWLAVNSKIVAKYYLFLLGVHVNVTGLTDSIKTSKGICFISNHTSLLDILLTFVYLDANTGFISKKEIAFVPFFNLTALVHNVVFMDRKSLKNGVKAINKGAKIIKQGCNMLIFPEGTRSKDGRIAPFKYGSFRLATQSNAVIVPLAIKGIRAALEDRKHCFCRTECCFDIGPEFKTDTVKSRTDLNALAIKIENHINSVYQTLGDGKNGK